MTDNLFHAHLDVCRQCRDNPASLCKAGQIALRAAVHGTDTLNDISPSPPSILDIMGVDQDDQRLMRDLTGAWGQFIP